MLTHDHHTKDLRSPQPTNTVYSCYFPQVAAAVSNAEQQWLTEHQSLLSSNIYPGLDDYHLPFIEHYLSELLADQQISNVGDFSHRYFTAGASEPLFHLLASSEGPLYQISGEYQGYQAYAEALGKRMNTVTLEQLGDAPRGTLLISNPSAVDGNLLAAIPGQHRIILDVAYLGMSNPAQLDLSDERIEAVIFSLSKPYGLYYYRIGFCLSHNEIASLYGNKWFKNIHSLFIAERVVSALPLPLLRQQGQALQQRALRELNTPQFQWQASDVYLLAHSTQRAIDPTLHRGAGSRACLTPYLYSYLQKGDS